jgi:hypothetical protein
MTGVAAAAASVIAVAPVVTTPAAGPLAAVGSAAPVRFGDPQLTSLASSIATVLYRVSTL